MRGGRRGWSGLVAAGVAAVAVVGPVLSAGAATTSEARIVSFTFSPGTIPIGTGDKVRWTNADGTKHTVTSDEQGSGGSFASGDIVKDGTYEHRFHTAGTFAYHCEHHPSMKGMVQVGPAPTTTTSSAPTTTSTAPTPSTVPPTTAPTNPPTSSSTAPPSAVPPTPRQDESVSGPSSTTSTEPPSTTTSLQVSTTTTTTTTAPPSPSSTVSSMPPVVTGADMADDVADVSGATVEEAARSQGTQSGEATGDGQPAPAAAPAAAPGSARTFDPAVTILVALLVAVGAFGAWSLFQLRPGKR